MSQDSLTQQIVKASGDVTKLGQFFAGRSNWDLATDAEQPAIDVLAAAITLDEHVVGLLRAAGAEPDSPIQPFSATKDDGSHDGVRLLRFSKFLRDLDSWIVAQPEPPNAQEAIAALKKMDAALNTVVSLVAPLAKPPAPATEEPPPIEDADASETPQPETPQPEEQAPPTKIEVNDEGQPLHLELDDTDERPLVHEFQGRSELTSDCEELVDRYLAAWNLEYNDYQRKKLLERLLRWITSAPEGQVLVLKMKTLEEPFEPYPSYVSRGVLAGEEPEKSPWS